MLTEQTFPHSKLLKLLIVAGDITIDGTVQELGAFNNWLGQQPFDHKIVIAGNHDHYLFREPYIGEKILTNATYLYDEMVTIGGLRIYGTPWIPSWRTSDTEYKDWAFALPRTSPKLRARRNAIPQKVDILVTHCPPKGILDKETEKGEHFGCAFLTELYEKRANPPRLHVFGHIHGGHGRSEGGRFVNAAICGPLSIKAKYKPIVVEL